MEQWYKCPQCNENILYGTNPCPKCKSSLAWSQQGPIRYIPPIAASQQQVVQPAASPQSPKKTTNPLVIILAIVGGGVLLLFVTCSICMGTFMAKPSNTAPVPVQTQNTEPPIYVSADELCNAYNNNEVAADIKYKGRVLIVTGVVESVVGKDFSDKPFIMVTGKYEMVQCMFTDKDLSTLAGISKGSNISVQGTFRGKELWPILDNCSIK